MTCKPCRFKCYISFIVIIVSQKIKIMQEIKIIFHGQLKSSKKLWVMTCYAIPKSCKSIPVIWFPKVGK